MNGEGWAFACWLTLKEGGQVSAVHGWQCVYCRTNWKTRMAGVYIKTCTL